MMIREILSQFREKSFSIYANTVRRTYFRLFGHQVNQRFVIVGSARTGSNYLLDGLESSRSIRMHREIFAGHNRQIGRDFDKIFSTLLQYESKSTALVGFKVFYNHLTEDEWKKLVAFKDLKVIHLTRKNRLRTVVSLEIAMKTGRWTKSSDSGKPAEKRVRLNPSKLLERLEQIEDGESATRARFGDRQILEIVYEELVGAPHAVFSSVNAYLGVDDINPSMIRLTKQNPEQLKQLIINYNDIDLLLKNTRFSECLYY